MQRTLNGGGEVVPYEARMAEVQVEVRLDRETVWLTQAQMAKLFGKNIRTISEHFGNTFKEEELKESLVIRNFRITARESARNYRGLLGGSKKNTITSSS